MFSPDTRVSPGLLLAAYALYIEHSLSQPNPPPALCDVTLPLLSVEASCSKTLGSPESHLLSYWGISPPGTLLDPPNAAIGVVYYCILLLPHSPATLVKSLTVLSLLTSAYLLSVLVGKGDVCLLCLSSHAVNAAIGWRVFVGGRGKEKSR